MFPCHWYTTDKHRKNNADAVPATDANGNVSATGNTSTTENAGSTANETSDTSTKEKSLKEKSQTLFTKHDAQWLRMEVNRISQSSSIFWRIVVVAIFGSFIVFVYFSDKIRRFFGHQTAQVATITLESESVLIKVGELTKVLVDELLDFYSKDAETKRVAINFAKSITEDPETTQSMVTLGTQVISNQTFQNNTKDLVQSIMVQVLDDTRTTTEVSRLMERVSVREDIQVAGVSLALELAKDPVLVNALEGLAAEVFAGDRVEERINGIAERTVNQLLENEEIVQETSQFLKTAASDSSLQETTGQSLWEATKIALIPSIFRSKQSLPPPPEKPKPSPGETEQLISVPEDKISGVVEILFREAFEHVDQQYGLQYTQEGINAKKREFEEELFRRREKYSASVKRRFQRFMNSHFEEVFSQDQELMDQGGEEALIIRAKTKIDEKISVYRKYLDDMEKLSHGYFWNTYTPIQLKDREVIQKCILRLNEEKKSNKDMVEKEIDGIRKKNPVAHLRGGTVDEYLVEKKNLDEKELVVTENK